MIVCFVHIPQHTLFQTLVGGTKKSRQDIDGIHTPAPFSVHSKMIPIGEMGPGTSRFPSESVTRYAMLLWTIPSIAACIRRALLSVCGTEIDESFFGSFTEGRIDVIAWK